MNTSNKHSVAAHAGRQSLSTKAAHLLVVLAIVASVAASFSLAFHHSTPANQQMAHQLCIGCGEEIPQGAGTGVKIAGGLSGGVVNDNA